MKNILLKSDRKEFSLVERTWEECHGITASFISLNEEENIIDFLQHLRPLVDRIVMIDGGSEDDTVKLAEPYVDTLRILPFKGHFAEQKNEALKLTYTDWTLFLDPDERLDSCDVSKIRAMIDQDEFDCYKFPRREFIDGEERKEPYPDLQARLFRTYCRFVRPIHEELVGWKNCKELEKDSTFDIIHRKTGVRHNKRNSAYPFFAVHYLHECGKPGEQLKDTFKKPCDLLKECKEEKDV